MNYKLRKPRGRNLCEAHTGVNYGKSDITISRCNKPAYKVYIEETGIYRLGIPLCEEHLAQFIQSRKEGK